MAVPLTRLEPIDHVIGGLLASLALAHALTGVLACVNAGYGNNSVYFGSMAQAVQANAALMRIPFGAIPTPGIEEDVARRSSSELDAGLQPDWALDELWLQRKRQFKVMAQDTYRGMQTRRHSQPHQAAQTSGSRTGSADASAPSSGWLF